ncbi:hypothetical protein Agub_g12695 [Astrephomene gubernaculifera]|uniref:Thiol-disulfide oxidoreductase DCC n=1 Tax=Astrephomene gubernaculifera TaxID=47775 RepID=A0AAD3E0G9_9CHLO|nr:hypothetical protein Agub_g12695 [Astrephomene gubernaculifera]
MRTPHALEASASTTHASNVPIPRHRTLLRNHRPGIRNGSNITSVPNSRNSTTTSSSTGNMASTSMHGADKGLPPTRDNKNKDDNSSDRGFIDTTSITQNTEHAVDGEGANIKDDFAADRRPVVLYDGVCNFCNGGVNTMLSFDKVPGGSFRFAALQSPTGRRLLVRCGRSPYDISSIVLVEPAQDDDTYGKKYDSNNSSRNGTNGASGTNDGAVRHYIRSEAVLRIARRLAAPLPALAMVGFLMPLRLRDALYNAVAVNRYSLLGRRDVCRLGDAGRYANRFIAD